MARSENRRSSRRQHQTSRDKNHHIIAKPYIQRNMPCAKILDDDGIELIEHNADYLLKNVGIEYRDDPESLEIWKKAGALINGENVKIDGKELREIIASAPSQFTQHARNQEKNVIIGDPYMVVAPGYGPPFIRNIDEGRRYANINDFENFIKLAYMLPSIHHSGGTVCEPVDIPVHKRHLDMVYSHMKYSDKPFMGSVTAQNRAQDTIEMCKILFSDEFVDQHCVVINLINANSPLVFDDTMMSALKTYSSHNQACVISPFILAGAMSPVSVAGTLTQIYAEVLSCGAFSQLIRKGAPIVFGTFAASMSMQTGAPTFGTAEASMVTLGAKQIAQRLNLPFRSGGGLCASKIADGQAGYEAAFTLQTATMAGVNFMLHGCGWLEGGLAMGYEKFVIDADEIMQMIRLAEGIDLSENGQALNAFEEVGPGNHFLGSTHTSQNYTNAFHLVKLRDNNSYEQWLSEGSQDINQRASIYWKDLLSQYQAPELDDKIDYQLKSFISERKKIYPDSVT